MSAGELITLVGLDDRPPNPAARAALDAARLVVGAARHLDAYPLPPEAATVTLGPLRPAFDAIAVADGPVVVLASGDPGFFGILRALREQGFDPAVHPAVSSVAAAFALAGLTWEDALVTSVHGRKPHRAVASCWGHPKVAVLCSPQTGPAQLGAALAGSGRTLWVVQDLHQPTQQVTAVTPEQATERAWSDLSVVLVVDERGVHNGPTAGEIQASWRTGAAGTPADPSWALPEVAFEHRDGMITKREVRALALARLGPRLGETLWDVGTGSGSMAVECARLGAFVNAIDHDPGALALAEHNAHRHGVTLRLVAGRAPAILASLPEPDAVFVGGGGPDVVAACAARARRTVVATLAGIDRVTPTIAALTEARYAVDAVQLQANRVRQIGGVSRLSALNPVTIVTGVRI